LEKKKNISNYCACFIDLLGQRNALKGQGIMPITKTKKEKADFDRVIIESVGAIEKLQKLAQEFRVKSPSPFSQRENLTPEEKTLYDEMKKVVAKQQRWSDGLVYYSSLETSVYKCPMSAVLEIFMLAGLLCFLGLANKRPIRGAIEVSWGIELHENELYGAVVANSYELESEIAQYPRIVVGQQTIQYLDAYLANPPDTDDKLALYNRNCAQLCKSITSIDLDGNIIIDYLSESFTKNFTNTDSHELYKLAYQFILDQYELHKSKKDTKLVLRYTWLRSYFNRYTQLHA